MKTLPKGPFLGVNNRLPDFALHVPKKGDFLRAGVNVDITNSGNIKRRKATALLQAVAGIHSLYTAGNGDRYAVIDSVLYKVTLPVYSQTFVATLTSNSRMSYVEYGGSLYLSNGTDRLRIEGGTVYPMALPTPTSPTVATTTGTLFPGKYQVAVAYTNATTGEEGGVSPSSNYELAAEGGLRVTLPVATTGATHVNVYVSTVNGSIPFFKASAALGTTYLDISTPATGREANQRYESPLPAGELFLFNGMLCSFKGSEVFEGIPARPGYYVPLNQREPEGGRIPFPATVSVVAPVQNGVYVVSDKTYWFAGTRMTKAETVVDVLEYGGVPGTFCKLPKKKVGDQFIERVCWFGADGFVIADTAGNAAPLTAENIDLAPPASGVSAVFSVGGYYRVVSCGWCLNLENGAATSYTDYDFTSVSGNYGTKADGIYDLAATGKVAWSVNLGKEDFGTEAMKHLPAVYLGVDSELPVSLRVVTPSSDYTYDARSSGTDTRIHRVDPGKGLRSNWYELSLLGESEFTLATVSFAPTASTRRI